MDMPFRHLSVTILSIIPGGQKTENQPLSFFTLLDRPSFSHYNNTKIIKSGSELFMLWVTSYGLSFSGFARFPEFLGTASVVHKLSEYCVHWSVYCQWTCVWSFLVLPNNYLQSRHVIGTDISLQLVECGLNAGMCWRDSVLLKLSLIVPRNSRNRANPENYSP